ncbi:MAG: glycosyltransferase [Luteimonas sp.]
MPPITFFLDAEDASLASWRTLQPDAEPQRLILGEDYWIVLSFARLRDAGMDVRLSNRVPDTGVVVFYAGDKRAVWSQLRDDAPVLLACVRSDRHPVGFADCEIVQNASSADGARALHVPHWPQPGLVARDATRGAALRVALFPGTPQNLDPEFTSPATHGFLRARGIELRTAGGGAQPVWNDYHDIDALLALRPAAMGVVANKPAWKLFNAWLAGVPAVLGRESGYRELREGPLDYIEVASPAEALRALQRLQDEPGLQAAMVANGLRRGSGFTTAATCARWQDLLATLEARRQQQRVPTRAMRRRRELVARMRRVWRAR